MRSFSFALLFFFFSPGFLAPGNVPQRERRGRIQRSSTVRRQFMRIYGLDRVPADCQIDHIKALTCGGPDDLSNLQLLCGEALREKERTERRCRKNSFLSNTFE